MDLSGEGYSLVYTLNGDNYYASINIEYEVMAGHLLPGKIIIVLLHSTGTKVFTLEPDNNGYWISNDMPAVIEESIIHEITNSFDSRYPNFKC